MDAVAGWMVQAKISFSSITEKKGGLRALYMLGPAHPVLIDCDYCCTLLSSLHRVTGRDLILLRCMAKGKPAPPG